LPEEQGHLVVRQPFVQVQVEEVVQQLQVLVVNQHLVQVQVVVEQAQQQALQQVQ